MKDLTNLMEESYMNHLEERINKLYNPKLSLVEQTPLFYELVQTYRSAEKMFAHSKRIYSRLEDGLF